MLAYLLSCSSLLYFAPPSEKAVVLSSMDGEEDPLFVVGLRYAGVAARTGAVSDQTCPRTHRLA